VVTDAELAQTVEAMAQKLAIVPPRTTMDCVLWDVGYRPITLRELEWHH
jgi:hypothetical protein